LNEGRENNAYIAALTQVIASMHAILKLSVDGTPSHHLAIPLILEEHAVNFATNKTQIVNAIAKFEGDMKKINLKVERLECDKRIQSTEMAKLTAEVASEKVLSEKLNIANNILGQENGNVKNESNVHHEGATKLKEELDELRGRRVIDRRQIENLALERERAQDELKALQTNMMQRWPNRKHLWMRLPRERIWLFILFMRLSPILVKENLIHCPFHE
jgi:hypothetical protein